MIRTYLPQADNRRKEILWLTLALLAALGLALFLVVYLNYARPLRTYDEAVVTFGLVVILGCAIAYFATKEREQRELNQSLVASLHDAVHELNQRVGYMDEVTRANGELSAALQGLASERDQSYLRALRALLATLDARDNYTALHGEQVTGIAMAIAGRMGLEPQVIETIRVFGPLHDIGKLAIPDQVLHKGGPLDPDEFALCLQHPAVGAAIVEPLRPPPQAVAIVRSHHERWDGAGYPDGLAGEEIPLVARIMGVADAYHAMMSQRPYRARRDLAQAVREMMSHAGAQFDPDVVGVLAQLAVEGELTVRGA